MDKYQAKEKYINHGLGIFTEKEHTELIQTGAIKCYSGLGVDAILADYPKLAVRKSTGEEETIDMGGNLFQITQERDSLQRQGKHASIEWFPRSWTKWAEKKYPKPEFN